MKREERLVHTLSVPILVRRTGVWEEFGIENESFFDVYMYCIYVCEPLNSSNTMLSTNPYIW